MNSRTTYILMGGVGLMLAILAGYAFFGSGKAAKDNEAFLLSQLKTAGVKPEKITSLEIAHGEEKLAFSREPDGHWRMTQPLQTRADSGLIDGIIRALFAAKKIPESEAEISKNLTVLGLDPPSLKLTLKEGGEHSATLSFGKATIGEEKAMVYVISSDDPNHPMAVRRTALGELFRADAKAGGQAGDLVRAVADFRNKKLIGEGLNTNNVTSEITRVTLKRGRTEVVLSNDTPDHAWRFVGRGDADLAVDPPAMGGNPENINSVRQLLNNIINISVEGKDYYIDNVENLEQYGLDKEEPLVVQIERNGGAVEKLSIGKIVQEPGRDLCYVRYDDESTVAKVNAQLPRALERFFKDPDDIRDKTLLHVRKDRIDAIDIEANGQKFALRKSDKNWKVYLGNGNELSGMAGEQSKPEDADAVVVDDFLSKLTQGQQVREFPKEKFGADVWPKPPVEVRVYEKGIVPSENPDPGALPKVSTPTATLQFGNLIGELVPVRRTTAGREVDYKVDKDLLELVRRTRLAYLDRSLKMFQTMQVAKFSFTREGKIYEFERDMNYKGQGQVWQILLPEANKGKLADTGKISYVLTQLGQTTASKVVADKPEDFKNFGLATADQAAGQAIVTMIDGVKQTYLFGKVGMKLYMRIEGGNYAYEVSGAGFDAMQANEDYRDLMLYHLEASAVKSIKLEGWFSKGTRKTTIIEGTRAAGGAWTPKGDFVFDPTKMENFLHLVLAPRAERIISTGVPPKEEYGLCSIRGHYRWRSPPRRTRK